MPQLRCECDSPDCEVDMQNGAGGYVIRGSDYRSNPAREGVCINERVCARRDQNGKETHITQMDNLYIPMAPRRLIQTNLARRSLTTACSTGINAQTTIRWTMAAR